ncbi:MgtC/SapB family protein [Noviherbaspirillum sp. ST9]|uniref:MgtC/SapB family protein n=1 Tax=Noviherbaspirillum sp. ST9 TaxID=3401606 RepID=UPI003B587852
MDNFPSLFASCAVALGGSILIGIERERHKGSGPSRGLAGVRTFALAGFGGVIASHAGQPAVTAAGALFIVLLGAIAYYRDLGDDPGITTEVALFVTYLLGIVAATNAQLSSAGFVVVACLLAGKTRLHHFATKTLTSVELRDGLLLAAAALVVYPLIPNRTISFLANANPNHLWRLIVLLMTLQAVGYVALRVMGPRYGLAIAGLASGVVSSSSTMGAMGARSKSEPQYAASYAAAALCSNLSSMALLIAVGIAIDATAVSASWPVIAGVMVGSGLAAVIAIALQPAVNAEKVSSQNVFSVRQAVGFAALLTALTAIVSLATKTFGSAAAEVGAAIAATVDMQAAGAVLFSLFAGGSVDAHALNRGLAIAITTNAISKMAIASAAGNRAYAARTSAGLALAIVVVWIAALIPLGD